MDRQSLMICLVRLASCLQSLSKMNNLHKRVNNILEQDLTRVSNRNKERTCPLCHKRVKQIPRHLRSGQHKLGYDESQQWRKLFVRDIDFGDHRRKSERKDERPFKMCPLCPSVVTRIDKHLTHKHKLGKEDRERISKYAKIVPSKTHASNELEAGLRDSASVGPSSQDRVLRDSASVGPSSQDRVLRDSASVGPSSQDCAFRDSASVGPSSQETNTIRYVSRHEDDRLSEEMSTFVNWLMSLDGGQKTKTRSLQMASHVDAIMWTLKSSDNNWCLSNFHTSFHKISQSFVENELQSDRLKAVTVKIYLNSLIHYLDFIRLSHMSVLSSTVTSTDVTDLQNQVKRWNKSVQKRAATETIDKQIVDQECIITPALMKKYEDGVRKRGQECLKRMTGNADLVSQDTHTLARNYLICELVLHNSNRSGVLINMKMRHYRAAQLQGPVDDVFVIHVSEHKTATTHKAAQLAVPVGLFEEMKMYIEHIRAFIPSYKFCMDGSDYPVFVNHTGTRMTQSDVTNSLNNCFENKTGFSVSCNKIRKTTTTRVCEQTSDPEQRKLIADHLKHTTRTQEMVYNLTNQAENARRASKIVSNVLRGQYIGKETQQSADEKAGSSSVCTSDESHTDKTNAPTTSHTYGDSHGDEMNDPTTSHTYCDSHSDENAFKSRDKLSSGSDMQKDISDTESEVFPLQKNSLMTGISKFIKGNPEHFCVGNQVFAM